MRKFQTIEAYCEAISMSPPKHPHFDIRSFEENMPSVVHKMEVFRHAFYAIAMKVEGGGKIYCKRYFSILTRSSLPHKAHFPYLVNKGNGDMRERLGKT